jgi:hypothetical protein
MKSTRNASTSTNVNQTRSLAIISVETLREVSAAIVVVAIDLIQQIARLVSTLMNVSSIKTLARMAARTSTDPSDASVPEDSSLDQTRDHAKMSTSA